MKYVYWIMLLLSVYQHYSIVVWMKIMRMYCCESVWVCVCARISCRMNGCLCCQNLSVKLTDWLFCRRGNRNRMQCWLGELFTQFHNTVFPYLYIDFFFVPHTHTECIYNFYLLLLEIHTLDDLYKWILFTQIPLK